MNINLTLFGEMITFAILVWVTMKYIWPPISKAMQEREKKIADGLHDAEKAKKSLELAENKSKTQLRDTKIEVAAIIEQANKRVTQMIEEGKLTAKEKGKKMLELAKADIAAEKENAQQQLRNQVAALVMDGTEKVLQLSIDKKISEKLIDKVIAEI